MLAFLRDSIMISATLMLLALVPVVAAQSPGDGVRRSKYARKEVDASELDRKLAEIRRLKEKNSQEAVGELSEIIKVETIEQVQLSAVMALADMRKHPTAAASALLKVLDRGPATLHGAASAALVILGRPAEPAVLNFLADGKRKNRADVVWVLNSFGPKNLNILRALVDALSDSEREVREAAAHVLDNWGSRSEAASDALEKGLNDSSARVRIHAASALCQIDTDNLPALAIIRCALEDTEGDNRYLALVCVSDWARPVAAERILPQIIRNLRDKDPAIRMTAAQVLRRIGAGAAVAIPTLRELVGREADAQVKSEMIRAISSLSE